MSILPNIPVKAAAGAIRARRGFTHIELLVVVAIIGVLAGILIPVLSHARQAARLATCLGRVRDLGVALQLHADDHGRLLLKPDDTAGGRWIFHLAPYLGPYEVNHNDSGQVWGLKAGSADLYQNPVIRDPACDYDPANPGRGVFGYNAILEYHAPVKLPALEAPALLPVLASSQGDVGGIRMSHDGPSPNAREHGYEGRVSVLGPAPNYDGKAVFLFADWHVAARDVCHADAWPWNDPQAFYPR